MSSELDGILQCGRLFPGTVLGVFRNADRDGNGIVSGNEAVEFFSSTGVDKKHLKAVWDLATEKQPGGLTPAQFSRALRLISLLQTGCQLTDDFVAKALDPQTGLRLPQPRMGPQYLGAAPATGGSDLLSGDSATNAHAVPRGPPSAERNPATPNGLAAEPAQCATPAASAPVAASFAKATSKPSVEARGPPLPATSKPPQQARPPSGMPAAVKAQAQAAAGRASTDLGSNMNRGSTMSITSDGIEATYAASCSDPELVVNSNSKHAPVATLRVCVRAQPHSDELAAPFTLLCAGQGLLFAAPTHSGGIAVWAHAESKIAALTHPSCRALLDGEDPLSIPASEVPPLVAPLALPGVASVATGATTVLHYCKFSELLLTGHADGKVAFWHLEGPDTPPEPRFVMAAHRQSGLSALATTPWGGLWTGAAGGSVRLWPHAVSEARACAAVPAALSQPLGRELRRTSGERAHFRCHGIALAASGQMMITIGRETGYLWDAQSGVYLGVLTLHNQSTSATVGIDVAAGVPLHEGTGRAVSGCQGQGVPPLGRGFAELSHGTESHNVTAAINKMSSTATMVTTAVAKRGLAGVRGLVKKSAHQLNDRVHGVGGSVVGALKSGGGGPGRDADADVIAQHRAYSFPDDEEAPNRQPSPEPAATATKLACMCTSYDGGFWLASTKGSVEHFSSNGRKLGALHVSQAGALCALCVGPLVWFGAVDGRLLAYDVDTHDRVAAFPAHASAVVALAQVGLFLYSLGADGTVFAANAFVCAAGGGGKAAAQSGLQWSETWRGVVDRWAQKLPESVAAVPVGIRAASWNVNDLRPRPESVAAVAGTATPGALRDVGIVVVGLQEIEMGTSSVTRAAIKEAIGKGRGGGAEGVTANGKWWADELLRCLQGAGDNGGWARLSLRQLSGLLIVVLARRPLAAHVTCVASAAVPCGVGGFGGNKGGVAVGLQLYRQRFLFIDSHFAAHQSKVAARNEDYATIIRKLTFGRAPAAHCAADEADDGAGSPTAADAAPPVATLEDLSVHGSEAAEGSGHARRRRGETSSVVYRAAHAVVWLGDFNYRIDLEREQVVSALEGGGRDLLKKHDQARAEMIAGAIFHGLREGPLAFAPTYKFDKGVPGPGAYDSSEKRRVPAWTDRVFFKGSEPFARPAHANDELDSAAAAPPATQRSCADNLVVRCEAYGSCPDVCDSDHKPVHATLRAEVPNVDVAKRRTHARRLLTELHAALNSRFAPDIDVASTHIALKHESVQFRIDNGGAGDAFFAFRGYGGAGAHGAACLALPSWLNVQPTGGRVPAKGHTTVTFTANRAAAARDAATSGASADTAQVFLLVDGQGLVGAPSDPNHCIPLTVTLA